eukprot:GHRQ01016802.1.p3 GENE.GHRQ01016802.1~~GHRQ01016802.1.p3  ORF type:complete len:111 (-),score=28.09 GHRQ01016802.1:508-840(-)
MLKAQQLSSWLAEQLCHQQQQQPQHAEELSRWKLRAAQDTFTVTPAAQLRAVMQDKGSSKQVAGWVLAPLPRLALAASIRPAQLQALLTSSLTTCTSIVGRPLKRSAGAT